MMWYNSKCISKSVERKDHMASVNIWTAKVNLKLFSALFITNCLLRFEQIIFKWWDYRNLQSQCSTTTGSKTNTKDNWMALMYCNNKYKFTAYVGNYLPKRLIENIMP